MLLVHVADELLGDSHICHPFFCVVLCVQLFNTLFCLFIFFTVVGYNSSHHHHHYSHYPHYQLPSPTPPPPPLPPSACDRWFTSSNPGGNGGNSGANSGNETELTFGTFTSPNYPEPYPINTRCTYHFIGHGRQRVQIIFEEFDIHKVEDQHRE